MAQQYIYIAELFDHQKRGDPDVNPYSQYKSSKVTSEDEFWDEIKKNVDIEERYEVTTVFANRV